MSRRLAVGEAGDRREGVGVRVPDARRVAAVAEGGDAAEQEPPVGEEMQRGVRRKEALRLPLRAPRAGSGARGRIERLVVAHEHAVLVEPPDHDDRAVAAADERRVPVAFGEIGRLDVGVRRRVEAVRLVGSLVVGLAQRVRIVGGATGHEELAVGQARVPGTEHVVGRRDGPEGVPHGIPLGGGEGARVEQVGVVARSLDQQDVAVGQEGGVDRAHRRRLRVGGPGPDSTRAEDEQCEPGDEQSSTAPPMCCSLWHSRSLEGGNATGGPERADHGGSRPGRMRVDADTVAGCASSAGTSWRRRGLRPPSIRPRWTRPCSNARGDAELVADTLIAIDADIVCLQETTPVDLVRILGRVGDRFEHHAVGNGRELWSNWTTAELPWEANGTAVLWKRSEFGEDHRGSCPLSDDGNVATWVGLTHRDGSRMRAMSVHLDVDDVALRRGQLPRAGGVRADGRDARHRGR